MRRVLRVLVKLVAGLAMLALVLTGVVWFLTYHPDPVEAAETTCPKGTPELRSGQDVRVMSWNVQYLAGRGYVFYYDLPDGDGPDKRPSRESIARTLDEVVRVIKQEEPDVVLLQEVDRGSSRTDGADQLALIKAQLGGAYPCTAAAFYHKARFVPHPKIMGSVGMSLGVLSRTRIDKATRYQLPHICGDPVTVAFNFDRAVLAVELPVDSGETLTAMETHLDAFAQGCDTMQRQVKAVEGILDKTEGAWLISGDFNLLATDKAYARLGKVQRGYFSPHTELTPLLGDYSHFPTNREIDSGNPAFFTHFPNDPSVGHPDRTIDYFFYSPGLRATHEEVRQDRPKISDHFAMLTTVTAP
ncbi:MAG: endonuclease/exonuclease/phosphatase family protein [Nocardioidaceae bacterium]